MQEYFGITLATLDTAVDQVQGSGERTPTQQVVGQTTT